MVKSIRTVGTVRVVGDQGTINLIGITIHNGLAKLLEVPVDRTSVNKELNKHLTDNEKDALCRGTSEAMPSSTTQQAR